MLGSVVTAMLNKSCHHETRKSQEHYVRYASGHSSSVKVCLPYGDPEYSGWEREESELARRGVHDRTAPCSGPVPESVSMGLMAAPASAAAPTKAGRTLDFPFCLEVAVKHGGSLNMPVEIKAYAVSDDVLDAPDTWMPIDSGAGRFRAFALKGSSEWRGILTAEESQQSQCQQCRTLRHGNTIWASVSFTIGIAEPTGMAPVAFIFALQVAERDLYYVVYTQPALAMCRTKTQLSQSMRALGWPPQYEDDIRRKIQTRPGTRMPKLEELLSVAHFLPPCFAPSPEPVQAVTSPIPVPGALEEGESETFIPGSPLVPSCSQSSSLSRGLTTFRVPGISEPLSPVISRLIQGERDAVGLCAPIAASHQGSGLALSSTGLLGAIDLRSCIRAKQRPDGHHQSAAVCDGSSNLLSGSPITEALPDAVLLSFDNTRELHCGQKGDAAGQSSQAQVVAEALQFGQGFEDSDLLYMLQFEQDDDDGVADAMTDPLDIWFDWMDFEECVGL